MELLNIRKFVLKTFTLNGYTVQAEAAAHLAENLLPLSPEKREKWMEIIMRKVHELNLEDIAVQKQHIEMVLEECVQRRPITQTVFNVISCLDVPCFTFDSEKCKYVHDATHNLTLFPKAAAKPRMYQRRYSLIFARLQRNSFFRKKIWGDKASKIHLLRTAEFYLSSSGKIEKAVMLGLLAQASDGHYVLEDPTGSLRLDLSQARFHVGLFAEQCFVLVEGVYDDEVFRVEVLGLPPLEERSETRRYYGNANYFGGPSDTPLSASKVLQEKQDKDPDRLIIFLSEVWLDDIKVFEKLSALFSGYSEFPPAAFVLMGSFLSLQSGPAYAIRLKAAMKSLGELIAGYPKICEESHIVLVPGPKDPGSPLILPRSPLPTSITEDIQRKVPHLWLATNPCRIQYCTREIVVFREDIVTKLCRNAAQVPNNTESIIAQFAKTLACQGTLIPLPLHVCPVHWSFSHGLDLSPLPDLIVVGDQFQPFIDISLKICHVINPGYFAKNDYSFNAYNPQAGSIDQSCVPDELS